MGQPTHCYDYSFIGNDLTLEQNTSALEFTNLQGSDVHLHASELVFTSDT